MKIDIIKPNLIEVQMGELSVVFSYTTPVILINRACNEDSKWEERGGNLYVTTKKYSATTSRHISYFLNEEINKDAFNVFEVKQNVLENLLYEVESSMEDNGSWFDFPTTESEVRSENETD